MQTKNQPELVYLTNDSGQATGYGTIELNEELLNKVPFDDEPGAVRYYIGEIQGRAFALAVLPLEHQENGSQGQTSEIKDFGNAVAELVGKEVRARLCRMFGHQDFHVLIEEGCGCTVVIAAVALDKLNDCMHTRQSLRNAFGDACQAPTSDAIEIERQLPDQLFLVANGSNGAAPNGCEIVLDDVEGGNEERDYYLISVVHGDTDVLKRMARRVRASWQLCSGIDTDRLEAMSLRGQTVRSETLRNHELITGLQAIAAIAISAAKDLANGYPERELAMPLDQIKAAAAKLGVH